MSDPAAILVAARDEEDTIGATVATLREHFPRAEVIVADDGSHDATAARAETAGATVLRLPHRGKGHALTIAERSAPDGSILLCDADLTGDLRPLVESDADLVIAAFAVRQGGGFGIVKRTARALIRLRCRLETREPISGQRSLSSAARDATFPLTPGFAGCEARMTVDAVNSGLTIEEVELDLRHRATGRDVAGFLHRGKQLVHLLLAFGPLATNHRGLRLPLVGWTLGVTDPRIAAVGALGLVDDVYGGPERGFRAHLRAGNTTGVLKLVGIPLVGLVATRKVSGALLVGLSANFVNQLDTRPGRALKAYLAGAFLVGAPIRSAVLLLPYDLREKVMLGDAGSNALGAMLGLSSVSRLTGKSRWLAIGALAGLTLLGERRSLGELIERTPGLRTLDRLGRQA